MFLALNYSGIHVMFLILPYDTIRYDAITRTSVISHKYTYSPYIYLYDADMWALPFSISTIFTNERQYFVVDNTLQVGHDLAMRSYVAP